MRCRQVAVHRRRQAGAVRRNRRPSSLDVGDGHWEPAGSRGQHGLVKDPQGDVRSARDGDDLPDSPAQQARQRTDGCDERPFGPHVGDDVG